MLFIFWLDGFGNRLWCVRRAKYRTVNFVGAYNRALYSITLRGTLQENFTDRPTWRWLYLRTTSGKKWLTTYRLLSFSEEAGTVPVKKARGVGYPLALACNARDKIIILVVFSYQIQWRSPAWHVHCLLAWRSSGPGSGGPRNCDLQSPVWPRHCTECSCSSGSHRSKQVNMHKGAAEKSCLTWPVS